MAIAGVPKNQVGVVVQDFIDNDEVLVVVRQDPSGTYLVAPGSDEATRSASEQSPSSITIGAASTPAERRQTTEAREAPRERKNT